MSLSMVERADDIEMKKRGSQAERFYMAIGLADDLRPFFVSDEAALYDIQAEDDNWVIGRVREHYGVVLTTEDFSLAVLGFVGPSGESATVR